MDRLLREGNPPAGQLASPKPQYKKLGVDEYAPVEGQHGAPFATLKDASGNIVSPATEDKLEQVRQLLTGVATEAKLEQARVLLNALSNKDFATQATLEVVQSELALIKSELDNIKQNQTSGDQKVQLSGALVEVTTIVNAVAIINNNTNYAYVPQTTLHKYADVDFEVTNTTNEPLAIAFRYGTSGSGSDRWVLAENGNAYTYHTLSSDSVHHVVPSGAIRIMLSSLHPCLQGGSVKTVDNAPFKKLKGPLVIAYRCYNAPLSGAVTINLVGMVN